MSARVSENILYFLAVSEESGLAVTLTIGDQAACTVLCLPVRITPSKHRHLVNDSINGCKLTVEDVSTALAYTIIHEILYHLIHRSSGILFSRQSSLTIALIALRSVRKAL